MTILAKIYSTFSLPGAVLRTLYLKIHWLSHRKVTCPRWCSQNLNPSSLAPQLMFFITVLHCPHLKVSLLKMLIKGRGHPCRVPVLAVTLKDQAETVLDRGFEPEEKLDIPGRVHSID